MSESTNNPSEELSPESFLKKIGSDVRDGVGKLRPVILVALGLILIFVGERFCARAEAAEHAEISRLAAQTKPAVSDAAQAELNDGVWHKIFGEVLTKLGELAIIGCVLELILHSDHYLKFFLRLVEDAMLGQRLARRFQTSEGLWKTVSKVYFSAKFPRIQDQLTNTLYSYFPTEHKFYLNEYNYTIKISSVNGSFVRVVEDVSYTIIPTNPKDRVPFQVRSSIFTSGGGAEDLSKAVALGVKIGELDLTASAKYIPAKLSDGRDGLLLSINEKLSGREEYRVSMLLDKTWDISVDPYKSFTTNSLIHHLTVSVSFDDIIGVTWLDIGVREKFADVFSGNIALTNRRIDKQYSGLNGTSIRLNPCSINSFGRCYGVV